MAEYEIIKASGLQNFLQTYNKNFTLPQDRKIFFSIQSTLPAMDMGSIDIKGSFSLFKPTERYISPVLSLESENNFKILGNNDLNMPAFNCNDSILSQERNNNFVNPTSSTSANFFPGINNTLQNNNAFEPMNNMPNSNILTPYGNYGYPFNNPFVPYYGPTNIFGNSILPLPDSSANTNEKKNKLAGKKGKKNKEMNDMFNSLGNIVPGMSRGVNLIFINSKFGNLMPGQSIQEESIEFSDSDEDEVPKKKKAKGTPKKKKKKNKNKNKILNQTQKTNPTIKNRPRYPKIRSDDHTNEQECSAVKENENENNDDGNESQPDNSE